MKAMCKKEFRRKSMILAWAALLCLQLPVAALAADTGSNLTPELLGVENVLGIISHVNIRQVDTKTNQLLKDAAEAKNQIYQDSPQVRMVQNGTALRGQPVKSLATSGKRPPSSKAQRSFF